MAVDLDDMFTQAVTTVEQTLRKDLAETFGEVLDNVADGVDGAYESADETPDDYAERIAGDYSAENITDLLDDAPTLLADAYRAGFDAAVQLLRNALAEARWAGI